MEVLIITLIVILGTFAGVSFLKNNQCMDNRPFSSRFHHVISKEKELVRTCKVIINGKNLNFGECSLIFSKNLSGFSCVGEMSYLDEVVVAAYKTQKNNYITNIYKAFYDEGSRTVLTDDIKVIASLK